MKRGKEEDHSSSDEGIKVFPQTYIVIKFSPKANEKAIAWFISKIRGKRQDGGAELLIRRQPYKETEGLVLHVSASKIKFLQIAEEMEIVKKDNSGMMREFVVSQLEDFLQDGMQVDDFLTLAERQNIVRHELENIRATAEDKQVPGYPNINVYVGKSLMQSLFKHGVIEKVYTLHDEETLRKLGLKWFWALFQKQPFEEIRLYFGEAVALYFIFIGFYTTALVIPTVLGFLQMFLGHETLPFFCVFNMLWVFIFLELWRRKCNELAFNWGTIGMTSHDEPRANFKGKMGIDPVTGKPQPQSPKWKTNVKMYCVSLPIVCVWLFGGYIMMLWSFWAEDELKLYYDPDSWILYIPGIVYSIVVFVVNLIYRSFATYLTEWENHRTQSQYDRHRVIKLVLFEFVNNFMSLFYIAFVLQDLEMLKQQVAIMLIILQAINHVQEALLPLLLRGSFTKIEDFKALVTGEKIKRRFRKDYTFNEDLSALPLSLQDVECLEYDDPRIEQSCVEGSMDEYEGTYDDYLELFIQFGYVILFPSVFPLAALCAVINNVIEIRVDAFKLCKVFQRPMARKVKDIGAWQRSFEIIGAISIMTNCGLLFLSPQIKAYSENFDMGPVTWFFCFVALEHILLGVRYILHQAIPDKPEWVSIALAKKNHVAKTALKNERLQKNSRFLNRRYQSVYGTNIKL